MFEKLEICPICKNDKLINHLICKDHFLTGESFAIVRCTNCSFLFTNPRPDIHSIAKYYQSEKYISHSGKVNNITNAIYKIARSFTLLRKVKLINSISGQKKVLDYGCATGEFLAACKKKGWNIAGMEPAESARAHAELITDAPIYSDLGEIPKNETFEIITLWHVLEHVHNLNDTFEFLKNKLSKTGKLLIALPNHQSYDAQLYNEYWAAYDVPRHLYHFSTKTMQHFIKKHGLKLYNILPMKLDAFYVSTLSEKYKFSKTNYAKSFINGYKSNIYAKKSGNNFSSLIYIAGK